MERQSKTCEKRNMKVDEYTGGPSTATSGEMVLTEHPGRLR